MEHTQEQEISLINVFWKILFGWRRLIIMGIVFAALIGGLQYARGWMAWKQQQPSSSAEEEETELPQEEQAKVDDILALEEQMDKLRSYRQDSIWMNLDAYNEKILRLRYYVDSDYTFNYMQENEADYTKDIISAYCGYVKSGLVADAVAKELNLSNQISYISELITVEGGDSEDRSRSVFEIVAAYEDTKTLEQIKPVIMEAVEGQTDRISNEIGSHTLKLMTDNISVRVDTNLILAKKEKNDAIYNYRSQMTSLEQGLSDNQKAVLEKEREKESDGTVEKMEAAKPSFSLKYAVLGCMFGIFLACGWFFLEIIFAARIQEAEEMARLYGMRILGELTSPEEKKGIFHFVDSLLLKWKNCNKKQISKEQQIRIASSNIEIACKNKGIHQIYATGSEIENQKSASIEQIWKNLAEAGIQVKKGDNVIYDAKSLKEMAEIGNVVFVEQIGVSLYAEIEKEIKAARENGVEVIGSMVIG